MNNCNLIIIKSISLFLIYIYSNIKTTLISAISYLIIKFLIDIITKSIKQIEYENSLIEEITKYVPNLKECLTIIIEYIHRHFYTICSLCIKIFIRYLNSNPTLFLYGAVISRCLVIIMSLFSIAYLMAQVLIALNLEYVVKHVHTYEFEQLNEFVETITSMYK